MPDTNPSPKHTYDHCMPDVAKWIGTMAIDLSRLKEFGQDELDALEAFIKVLSCSRIDGELVEDDDFAGLHDHIIASESVGKAVADCFSAYRGEAKAESLVLPMLIAIADVAYKHGVSDAYREVITQESQRRIAASVESAQHEREAMRDLYNDLRME